MLCKACFLKTIISISIICILIGCSAFRPHTQQVTISTSAPDADIWVNGRFAGKSPTSLSVKRNRNLSVIARKTGYEPAIANIDEHLNTTGILDAVGCPFLLLPCIGLFFPGAWSIEETDIMLRMFPIEGENKQQ